MGHTILRTKVVHERIEQSEVIRFTAWDIECLVI
jgi:hypothetical protein